MRYENENTKTKIDVCNFSAEQISYAHKMRTDLREQRNKKKGN